MNHGFNNLGLNRIWANTLELNIGAQRLLERLGFSKEGCSRKAVYFAGRYFDKLHYGFLRDEYNDIWILNWMIIFSNKVFWIHIRWSWNWCDGSFCHLDTLPNTALVDSEWCRAMNPYNMDTVVNNLYALIKNYLLCPEIEVIVFPYGFHGDRKHRYEKHISFLWWIWLP